MAVPIIAVIVGATAVGKSAAAVRLAGQINGEVINADSRQVYRGFDIGTGIPSRTERSGIAHYLYGFSAPDDEFSLGRFLTAVTCTIEDIHARGKIPLIVGGTGQYVWALVEGWNVPEVAPNPDLRRELMARAEVEGRAALHAELARHDPAAAEFIHPNNLLRTVRALEVVRATGRPFSEQRTQSPPLWDIRMAGLTMDRKTLEKRIERRTDLQLGAGWVDEVRTLLARGYSPSLSAFRSIGYREVAAYINGRLPWDEMRQATISKTRRFSHTQFAWFRRDDERISWLDASPQESDVDQGPHSDGLIEDLRKSLGFP